MHTYIICTYSDRVKIADHLVINPITYFAVSSHFLHQETGTTPPHYVCIPSFVGHIRIHKQGLVPYDLTLNKDDNHVRRENTRNDRSVFFALGMVVKRPCPTAQAQSRITDPQSGFPLLNG